MKLFRKNVKLSVIGLAAVILLTLTPNSYGNEEANYQTASDAYSAALNEIQELKSSSNSLSGAQGLMFTYNIPHGPTMTSENLQNVLSAISSAKASMINQIRSVQAAAVQIIVETAPNNTPMIPVGSSIIAEAEKISKTPVPVELSIATVLDTATSQISDTATSTSEPLDSSVTVIVESKKEQITSAILARLKYWERRWRMIEIRMEHL